MKVLITGASGLLGREVYKVFKESGCETIGVAFTRACDEWDKLDLTIPSDVEDYLKLHSPEIVIHLAANRFPDKIERDYDQALKLNVESTETLCLASSKVGASVVYISTDYVFDGLNPPYKESDSPNPVNKYGMTKFMGEEKVLRTGKGNIVLRVPILYGNVEHLEESAITYLYKVLMNTEKEAEVSSFEIRCPSHVNDIALVLLDLCRKKYQAADSVHGIYQWCGRETFTKYDIVMIMAKLFGLPTNHIIEAVEPVKGAAPRPLNTTMDTTRLKELGIGHHTVFEEGIKQALGIFI